MSCTVVNISILLSIGPNQSNCSAMVTWHVTVTIILVYTDIRQKWFIAIISRSSRYWSSSHFGDAFLCPSELGVNQMLLVWLAWGQSNHVGCCTESVPPILTGNHCCVLMCVPGAYKVLMVQVRTLLAHFVLSVCNLILGPYQEGPISNVLSQQSECWISDSRKCAY